MTQSTRFLPMPIQNGLYRLGRALLRIYVRWHLGPVKAATTGAADIPTGPCIIAPNHPTSLDPCIIPAVYPTRVYMLVTESAFKVPVVRHYLRAIGFVPVAAADRRAAFIDAQRLLEQGKTVVIFPEGDLSGRTETGGGGDLNAQDRRAPRTKLKLHTGVVRLAQRTGAAVLPMGIAVDPTQLRAVPTGVRNHLGQEEIARLPRRGAPYAVTTGTPLYFRCRPSQQNAAAAHAHTATLAKCIEDLRHSSARRVGLGGLRRP